MATSIDLLVPGDGAANGFARVTSATEYRLGEVKADIYGNRYKYTEFADSATYAAGQVLTWADATGTKMTNDRSGGSSVSNRFAGLCMGVPTSTLKYGWAQVSGFYATIVTNGDDDIAAGDSLIVATGTDGACDSVAAATTTVHTLALGHAVAADVDAANTVAGVLTGEAGF